MLAKMATCTKLEEEAAKCKEYFKCHAIKMKAFVKAKEIADKQVAQQKLQWRLLSRAKCLTGAYDKDGNVVKSKLDECSKVKVYSTGHLNLTSAELLTQKRTCHTTIPPNVDPSLLDFCNKTKQQRSKPPPKRR